MKQAWLAPIILVVFAPGLSFGQAALYQTEFPADEFRARWKTVCEKIGDHALAAVAGASQANGFIVPRQSNEFYHLCGIETPRAYLMVDDRDRRVTLVLPPRDAGLESAEGKVLSADDAEFVDGIRSGNRFLRGAAGFPPRSRPLTGPDRPTDLNPTKTVYRI
jgi:Xaa-Pro aminopeptidase